MVKTTVQSWFFKPPRERDFGSKIRSSKNRRWHRTTSDLSWYCFIRTKKADNNGMAVLLKEQQNSSMCYDKSFRNTTKRRNFDHVIKGPRRSLVCHLLCNKKCVETPSLELVNCIQEGMWLKPVFPNIIIFSCQPVKTKLWKYFWVFLT